MGVEILGPLIVFMVWELAIFLALGIVYALIFRFRRSSTSCRRALNTILDALAFLLLIPSLLYLCVFPISIIVLVDSGNPFSGGQPMFAGIVFAIGGVIAAGWWGLWRLGRGLKA